ncbi:LAME_0F18008g1_1 [Lachancea meyersii CBS 8951]|uniref:LAME_0F18008g1_1 n=1 Tax=Lachancea meyersii CBS 8951 TaxID=1266667 RepID=A0A1G4K0K6_9SACH|nr:LAME_0F18008g1_1 [Lachancea meyersii CBS 8951]
MDAGTASFGRNQSNKAQLRSQLLSNDVGNINVAEEPPVSDSRAVPPMMGNPNNFPPNGPQFYASHDQHLQYGRQPPYGNQASHAGGMPASGFPSQGPRASSITSQSTAGPGKRSLQSTGISNLFKFRQGRYKERENDNEEEIFMTDSENSVLTFNDISSMRNNGGHKYGFGGGMDDTSPIIPTLMTKSHQNMSNIEYRKHMAAQKKMNYNTITKQNKFAAQGGVRNDPRAMSLQHSRNPYASQQQYGNQMSPYAHADSLTSGPPSMAPYGRANSMMAGPPPSMPPYARANSLMAGPPQQARGWGPQLNVPRPANNEPRAMSLTAGTGRGPMLQQHAGLRPQPGTLPPRNQGMPAPVGFQGATGPRNWQPAQGGSMPQAMAAGHQQYMPQHGQQSSHSSSALVESQPDNSKRSETSHAKEYETPLSSSSAMSTNSLSSYRVASQTPESQQAEANEEAIKLDAGVDNEGLLNRKSMPSSGKLNIIKLSDPQQKELKGKELGMQSLQHQLVQPAKETENAQLNGQGWVGGATENGRDISRHNLDRSPTFQASSTARENSQYPTGAIDNNRRRSQIQSMATMESALSSDSPTRRNHNHKSLYMLENGTDTNAYVTASELLDEDVIQSERNISETTITKRAEPPASGESKVSKNAANPAPERKDNGFGKTRNFLRKLSSRSNKSDSQEKGSRQSSAGSFVNRSEGFESVSQDRDGAFESKLWNAKSSNPKRKSFHSLFSNSSGGTNSGERVKSYASLANIEEKKVEEKSTTAEYQNADRRESRGSLQDTTLTENDINMEGSFAKTSPIDSSEPLDLLAAADFGRSQDEGDEFNFDNTVSGPYKPLYASQEDLDLRQVANDDHKFKTIFISSDQLSMLTEQNSLMKDIDLLSKELAESVSREARLEQEIAGRNRAAETKTSLSFADFEIELRKKSSKVVELIQQLNDERLRRYIAEEQVMLQENGAKPSTVDLIHKIHSLEQSLASKDQEIAQLTELLGTKRS